MGPFSTHRFLVRLALSAAHLFAWLFIFQYYFVISGSIGFSAAQTALTYAVAQVVGVLLTPYTARRLRHGVRGMFINALLCLAGAFTALALGFSGLLGSIPFSILIFAVALGAYRALYWIPYEISSRK